MPLAKYMSISWANAEISVYRQEKTGETVRLCTFYVMKLLRGLSDCEHLSEEQSCWRFSEMNKWSMKKLEEVAEFTNGGAWNQDEYVESGIPVVRVSDIEGSTINLSDCKFLPLESLAKYRKHILFEGDIFATKLYLYFDSLLNVALNERKDKLFLCGIKRTDPVRKCG
jgi:hypothetical protein